MKRFSRSSLIISITLVLMLIFTACGSDTTAPDSGSDNNADGSDEVFNWRLQCAFGEVDLEYIGLDAFFDEITEKSGGRLVISKFPGGAVVPVDGQLEAAAEGAIDISHNAGASERGKVPIGDIEMGLIGQYPGFGTLDLVMDMIYEFEDGALLNVYREAYAEAGVYYLGAHSHHGYPVIIADRPIVNVEDIRGLSIRSAGVVADVVEALGASAVYVPGSEVYTELQLGTMNGTTWSNEAFLGYSIYEVAPYIMVPALAEHSMSHLVINIDSWNALPPDLQQIVEDAYRNVYIQTVFNSYEEEWDRIYDGLEEHGYEIVELSDEFIDEVNRISREQIWPTVRDQDDYTRRAMEIIDRWYEQHGN